MRRAGNKRQRFPSHDGLMAALGGFTLRALAAGHVEPDGIGGHSITAKRVAVFVHDKFDFAEENNFWQTSSCGGAVNTRKGRGL